MNLNNFVRIAALGLLVLAAASASAKAPASTKQDEVRAAFMQFFKAYSEHDAVGMAQSMTSDILLSYPGREDVNRAKIEQQIAAQPNAPATVSQNYAVDIEEVMVSGDLAVIRVQWTVTSVRKDTGKVATSREKDVEIWRREADGRWRFARGISFPLKPAST